MPSQVKLADLPEMFLAGNNHETVHQRGGCTQSAKATLISCTAVTLGDMARFPWMTFCHVCKNRLRSGIFLIHEIFTGVVNDGEDEVSQFPAWGTAQMMAELAAAGYAIRALPKDVHSSSRQEYLDKIEELTDKYPKP